MELPQPGQPLGGGLLPDQKSPLDQLDPPIRALVAALNAFPAIQTIGSCGGHPHPHPGQWPTGSWYVAFELAGSYEGWQTLRFLAWAINYQYPDLTQDTGVVTLIPTARQPWLFGPAHGLECVVEGNDGADATTLAAWIEGTRRAYYQDRSSPAW
jgi:hypothetical protein